ncbi:hypothetical protein Bca52824_002504 [Brassica carinata]|uniref:Uncharacterized protein n=1 Tax=Brassica carinata TaxID=52824 RepID=A0A8X7WKB5_BRACI|nr:hypothetical protein Bca52824_002504 [Brassica carinata]
MRFSGLFSALLTVIDLSPQTMKDSVDAYRGKCCPVLGAWLYSAYSTTALSRSIPSSAVRNATSAVTSAATMPEEDMPLLPNDSETCVDVDGMRLRRGRKGRLGRGASPSVIHLPMPRRLWKIDKIWSLDRQASWFWKFETTENMVRGTSQDDCAVVIIVSTNGGFAGISKDGQTYECNYPIYYKGRYDEIIREDDNMIERSTNLDWYKGPTLLEILDQINKPKQPSDKPLRLQLQYV